MFLTLFSPITRRQPSKGDKLINPAAIPSHALRLIQRPVSALKYALQAISRFKTRQTAGDGHGDIRISISESAFGDMQSNLIRQLPGGFNLSAWQQHGEFLAAVAGQEIRAAQATVYLLGNHAEDFVTCGMTIVIIDLLEVINIPDQKRQGIAKAFPALKFLLKLFLISQSVGNSGQWIFPETGALFLKQMNEAIPLLMQFGDLILQFRDQ
jgi:hypothetical protein